MRHIVLIVDTLKIQIFKCRPFKLVFSNITDLYTNYNTVKVNIELKHLSVAGTI